ncbi:hypothetical protein AQZ52_06095 [Novosphingobium fuchskuhlense]|uniref:Cupin type-2 domain-containing protein n=1 Tax=Novosphingobium fuchskuhlense TaxID=1117702 RepID=A0A117UXQ8_9SPHN|nr:cupin domain-containing protein [Novosphingobium fuchskuhlense]KUR72791.1 hypothetical protein AQZ52_06095 [Novosphingobium fuchskuhlense]
MDQSAFRHGRLTDQLPANTETEEFLPLVTNGTGRVERIVSAGQITPPGFWYDQEEDEFVLLVAGGAILTIDGREQPVELKPGDWISLPAHCRHRVEWTSADPITIWLAVFTKP